MLMNKKKITIISPKQAKSGYRFIFEGPTHICLSCNYLSACVDNLESGRIYEIKKVLKKKMDCKLHEDEGSVVEVEEITYPVNMKSQAAVLDAIFRFEPIECEKKECPNNESCIPQSLKKGDICKILEITKSISCPLGLNLVSVQLERQSQVS
jgi:uncharacterized protein (UPF0179 family)